MFRRKSKQPEDVFTPRSAQVNPDMYIPRPGLETSLRRGLLGNLHVVLHGESGTGKTWLYKKVFADDGVQYKSQTSPWQQASVAYARDSHKR